MNSLSDELRTVIVFEAFIGAAKKNKAKPVEFAKSQTSKDHDWYEGIANNFSGVFITKGWLDKSSKSFTKEGLELFAKAFNDKDAKKQILAALVDDEAMVKIDFKDILKQKYGLP